MAGVPDPLDLLAVTDADGTDWLTLVGNDTWEQPLPVEIVAKRGPRLVTWMQLHGYLVPTTKVDGLTTWAQGQDWFGRWMPDTAEPHNVLLGAHPDGLGWESADGATEWWPAAGRVPPPCELQQCALWYGGTGTQRDASAGDETCGLSLSMIPSVVPGGPGLLVMRRDLASAICIAPATFHRPFDRRLVTGPAYQQSPDQTSAADQPAADDDRPIIWST